MIKMNANWSALEGWKVNGTIVFKGKHKSNAYWRLLDRHDRVWSWHRGTTYEPVLAPKLLTAWNNEKLST